MANKRPKPEEIVTKLRQVGQAFSTVLIDDVERAERFPVVSAAMDKVVTPDMIATLWP